MGVLIFPGLTKDGGKQMLRIFNSVIFGGPNFGDKTKFMDNLFWGVIEHSETLKPGGVTCSGVNFVVSH